MRFGRLVVVTWCLAGLLTATMLVAQEGKAAAPKMSAEQQAMMDKWMKIATPGEEHKQLVGTAGSWTVKSTMWETPGQPPTVSSGTSENTSVLGGRFVRQTFKGDFNGMPFEGIGYTGYDNYKKVYTSVWMDSMGTMMMILSGKADASGKIITMTGTIDDVMQGKPTTIRTVTHLTDKDHMKYEMYGPEPTGGKEYKMMEILYTRK
jgi:hypothetical protein